MVTVERLRPETLVLCGAHAALRGAPASADQQRDPRCRICAPGHL